jgi:hypothetical protein
MLTPWKVLLARIGVRPIHADVSQYTVRLSHAMARKVREFVLPVGGDVCNSIDEFQVTCPPKFDLQFARLKRWFGSTSREEWGEARRKNNSIDQHAPSRTRTS